jgi:transposase
MASINQQSVREELDRIKSDFTRLNIEGKINSETQVLVNSLLVLINLLVAIFMEKITKKNNKNSSISSSQTDKDESDLNSNSKTNGKGKKEKEEVAYNTRTIETSIIIPVTQCDICGQDLSATPCSSYERRTIIDIIFTKTMEHTDAEIKTCNHCNSVVKGRFPKNLAGPLQYGNGIKAYIINLLICQMIALNRVQKLVKTMIGEAISEATMLKFIFTLYKALESWENQAKEELLLSLAMHNDETSLRVAKQNYWIHVYSSGDITLKFLHRRRGLEAMEDINIIPRYSGIIIHDCWASYLSYDHCAHGLCGSHLTRELTHAIEANNYDWAKSMKELLLETCKKVSDTIDKKITDEEYNHLQKCYQSIITQGEKELPEIPEKLNGKKGKIAKSDAHNLWDRLKKYEEAVLLFAKKPEVSFTNNRAEQDIRMAKVKQKVSGCFRTETYAKAYCRISSYLQTMANKGCNPLIAIQMALAGKI